MSQIYEALKRSGGPGPEAILNTIGEVPAADYPQMRTAITQEGRYRKVPLHLTGGVPIFPFDGSDPETAEQYRMLRASIRQHAARPQMCVMGSACPGDGKTMTAVNTAGILALKAQGDILLIDGDLRRSTVARVLGIENTPGLAEVLAGTCSLRDAIVEIADLPGLHVLPAGNASNPAELLESQAWHSLARTVRERFQYVIVDSTPFGAVADFELLQVVTDGVLVVVRPDHTKRPALNRMLAAIPPNRLIGMVINAFEPWPLHKVTAGYYSPYR